MKSSRNLVSIVTIVILILAGCSNEGEYILGGSTAGDEISAFRTAIETHTASTPVVATSIVINGYLVRFDDRVFADGKTTFFYTVSGAGALHNLSNFFLEIPDCSPALESFSPDGAIINVNPLIDIYGIKWDKSLATDGSRSYSITFPGDVPLGIIRTAVKASDIAEIGVIAGPCGGFEISGTVYVDADVDGTKDAEEECGIVDVTVSLVDGGGAVHTAATDADGYYAFLVFDGTYTVRIDTETADIDFNEELAKSFNPTSPLSKVVTVGPDSPGNDFGFDPRAEEITYELEQGILLTTGEPVKFWRKQLRAAIGGRINEEYDPETMAQFIAEIQSLFLLEPFRFTPGNEFEEALAILSTKTKDPVDLLLRELLTAEFNEVSGKGIVEADDLQSVMLAWAESVALAASSMVPLTSIQSGDRPLLTGTIDDRVGDAIAFLVQLNGNIGGGSGGGG